MKTLLAAINAKFIHANLAVRYLREYVKPTFPQTEMVEFNINQPLQLILAQIVAERPDVLGISCYIWNWDMVQKLVTDIKKVMPRLLIVLGGPEVSYDCREHLHHLPAVDFIIRGEGEEPLRQLLLHLAAADDLERWGPSVPGLVYRSHPSTEQVLPHQMDLALLRSPYGGKLGQLDNKVLYYESSRGCPYRCSFCLSSLSGPVRYLPLERVQRELEHLLTLRPKQIRFVDRTFNADPRRAETLIRWLASQNTDTRFQLEITGDILTDSLLDALNQAPAERFQLEIGVQSASEDALAAVQRNSKLKRLEHAVRSLRSGPTPTRIMLDLIAGLPGETLAMFGRSLDFVFNLKPTKIHLGFLKFLRGSQLRQQAATMGYCFQEHPPYEILAAPWLDFAELQHLHVVEDLVERYFNSGRFSYTLPWLVSHYQGSAYSFFSSFAQWWQQHDLQLREHGSVELYPLLLEFASTVPQELLRSYLALDFRIHHRTQPLPGALGVKDAGKAVQQWLETSNFAAQVPQFAGLSPRQIRKRLHSLQVPATVVARPAVQGPGPGCGREQILFFHYPDLQMPAEVLVYEQSRNSVIN